MRTVGVDGARGGWLAARLDGRAPTWSLEARIGDVLAPDVVVAVDMPIGLAGSGHRPCDLAARRFLRAHGGSAASVFLTPPRPVLADHRAGLTYAEALAAARARDGRGFSTQAWYLLPRIAELEDAGPAADRVVEAHPECAFRRLGPVMASKRTPAGLAERRALLAAHVDLAGLTPPRGAGWDDCLDATVLALVARSWTAGTAEVFDAGRDALGLPMRIAC